MNNRIPSFRLNALAAVSLALSGLALAGSAQATTFHVRTDGGDASQCTGRADAPYPGSGTAQACAWKHPFFALTPGGGKRIAGGDTVVIGSGSYLIGAGAPGANNCSGAGCYMPAIPSGTTTVRTRFVGKSASAPPKLIGNNGGLVLNLQGSSNVEVGNLEITDQNDCVYQHSNSTANCSGSNWAKTGLSARASSNVWVHDVNIHGMAHQGMLAAGLTNWTVERVKLVANGRVGWEGNIGSTGSSNSGNIILRDVEVSWNGCGERWQTGAPWACWAQQTGGFGDGLATTYTGGKWLIENSYFHHNTADGLDMRYADGADSTSVTVRRLYAVGNAGNQVKIRGNSTIENSVIVGNCGYFKGKHFMLDADNCRANGNSLQLVMTPNDVATVRHNTITGEGGVLIGANEGDSTGRIYIQNNVAVGFRAFPYTDGRLAAFYYANSAPAPVSYAGNLIWNAKTTCPSGSICNQNPQLTNMTLPAFDAEPLAGSPVVDKVSVMSAVNSDFLSAPRPSGAKSDIGAYELQIGGATPTPTPTPTPTCTRAAPTLTMSGPTAAVAAGTTNTYSVALRNNDTSACSNASFNLARTVSSGWTGVLSTTSIALAPGASGTASLKVTSPTTATEGSYGIGVGTSSSIGSVHTRSASATYAVLKPAAPAVSLTTVATTLKGTYAPGEAMRIFGLVKNNGVVLQGVNVQFVITQPDGRTTQNSSISGSDGYARASHTASLVPGTHWLKATWSYGGQTSSDVVSFKVEAPAVSLSTKMTTNKTTYTRGEAMRVFALVKNNGVVLKGVSVKFVITQPDGRTTQVSSTSGSDGYARASHRASRVRGTHWLKGTWSYGGKTSSGVVSFYVK